jgi:lysophospholipase L1-like esterase
VIKQLVALLFLALPLAAQTPGSIGVNSPAKVATTGSASDLSGGVLSAASLNALRSSFHNGVNAPSSIVVIGDSIFDYVGPSNYANSPIVKLSSDIRSMYGSHGTGEIPVGGNNGLTTNPEWTLNGTVTTVNDLGPFQTGTGAFGTIFRVSGTGNFFSLPSQYGDTLKLYMESTNDTGGCAVQIDGGTSTVLGNTTNTTPTLITSSIGPMAIGLHNVNIGANTSGACYLKGAEWITGNVGITVHKIAHGYARSEAFGSSAATQLADIPLMSPIPSAAIIGLGVNNCLNGTQSLAQYQSDLQNIVSYLRSVNPQMAVLIADEHNITGSCANPNFSLQSSLKPIEQSIATQNGGSYVSIGDAWGSEVNANALGLMASDGVHPSDKGGLSQAGILEAVLMDTIGVTVPTAPNIRSGTGGYAIQAYPNDRFVYLSNPTSVSVPASPVTGEVHTLQNYGSSSFTISGVTGGSAQGLSIQPNNAATIQYTGFPGAWYVLSTTSSTAPTVVGGTITLYPSYLTGSVTVDPYGFDLAYATGNAAITLAAPHYTGNSGQQSRFTIVNFGSNTVTISGSSTNTLDSSTGATYCPSGCTSAAYTIPPNTQITISSLGGGWLLNGTSVNQ